MILKYRFNSFRDAWRPKIIPEKFRKNSPIWRTETLAFAGLFIWAAKGKCTKSHRPSLLGGLLRDPAHMSPRNPKGSPAISRTKAPSGPAIPRLGAAGDYQASTRREGTERLSAATSPLYPADPQVC